VKSSRHWIVYTVIRVGLFAVALAGLLLLGINPWISAVAAAVISLCIAFIFFQPQRDAVVSSIAETRATQKRDADSDAENEALDRADQEL
jgi:divalent metal cation (Fe/Co/Zn/Cd) transporter